MTQPVKSVNIIKTQQLNNISGIFDSPHLEKIHLNIEADNQNVYPHNVDFYLALKSAKNIKHLVLNGCDLDIWIFSFVEYLNTNIERLDIIYETYELLEDILHLLRQIVTYPNIKYLRVIINGMGHYTKKEDCVDLCLGTDIVYDNSSNTEVFMESVLSGIPLTQIHQHNIDTNPADNDHQDNDDQDNDEYQNNADDDNSITEEKYKYGRDFISVNKAIKNSEKINVYVEKIIDIVKISGLKKLQFFKSDTVHFGYMFSDEMNSKIKEAVQYNRYRNVKKAI